jgi:MYXO-CTERM domain-containing protein
MKRATRSAIALCVVAAAASCSSTPPRKPATSTKNESSQTARSASRLQAVAPLGGELRRTSGNAATLQTESMVVAQSPSEDRAPPRSDTDTNARPSQAPSSGESASGGASATPSSAMPPREAIVARSSQAEGSDWSWIGLLGLLGLGGLVGLPRHRRVRELDAPSTELPLGRRVRIYESSGP